MLAGICLISACKKNIENQLSVEEPQLIPVLTKEGVLRFENKKDFEVVMRSLDRKSEV